MDIVKPLKFESTLTGTELDLMPTEADPSEDYVAGKGISFEGTSTYLARKLGRVLIEAVPDGSQKITYNASGDVDYVEFFITSTQTTGNRKAKCTVTYTSGDPTAETWLIYDTDGTTVLETIVNTYTITSGNVTSAAESRT